MREPPHLRQQAGGATNTQGLTGVSICPLTPQAGQISQSRHEAEGTNMIRWCRVAKRVLSHLTAIDWAAVNMKLALGVAWPFFYFSGSPVRVDGFDGALLWAWCLCVIVGFLVSVAGLIAAAQPRRFRYSGRQIEMAGIWLLLGAPLCYGILQAGLWEETGNPIRGAQVALAWAIGSALVMRLLVVKRDGVRQAASRMEEGS